MYFYITHTYQNKLLQYRYFFNDLLSKQFVTQHQHQMLTKKIMNFASPKPAAPLIVNFVEIILIPKKIFLFYHPEFEFV